jgi:hypothetical protein
MSGELFSSDHFQIEILPEYGIHGYEKPGLRESDHSWFQSRHVENVFVVSGHPEEIHKVFEF